MDKIGIIRFRSALSAGDKTLKEEEKQFLSSIDPKGVLSFVKASKNLPNLFFIQTGGSETYFKDCYQDYPEPYCLLVQGKRNSLAAALEIKSFLDNKGKRCLLILGKPEKMLGQIQTYIRYFNAERRLSKMRLGVIGKPSDWLIASEVNYKEAKKRLGVELINIPMKELIDAYDEGVSPDSAITKRFLEKTNRRADLRKALYVYSAIKKVCAKNKLSGFTLRCFDLLKTRQVTSCLAYGILNDEGIIATCEGDVPAMLTMALVEALYDEPSFMANPAEIDVEEGTALFAHCTCPLSMTRSYTLGTHFESGLGFGIRGKFPKSKMTLCKISPDLSKIRALSCRILDNPVRADLCRSQIKIRFDDEIDCLLKEPYGNHCVFMCEDRAKDIKSFYAYLLGE